MPPTYRGMNYSMTIKDRIVLVIFPYDKSHESLTSAGLAQTHSNQTFRLLEFKLYNEDTLCIPISLPGATQ